MNDHELDLALADLGATRVQPTAPSVLRERVRAMPLSTKRRRRLLPRPTWRLDPMFSATKFLVAGAIVALVGGILLSGLLTQQSSDGALPAGAASASSPAEPGARERSIRSDVLPGVDFVVNEVEPGVLRVLSDGVREIARPAGDERFLGNVVAGLDGSVWWIGPDGFYRLGGEAASSWPGGLRPENQLVQADYAVTPDGTLWANTSASPEPNAAAWDGEGWTEHSDRQLPAGIEVQDDGTVWGGWSTNRGLARVGRLTADGWDILPGGVPGLEYTQMGWPLAVASRVGGEVWLYADGDLHVHDGSGWRRQPIPQTVGEVEIFDVGPDGTVWVHLSEGDVQVLARFDGSEWTVCGAPCDIPRIGRLYQGLEAFFQVGPDGSVWFNPNLDSRVTGTSCAGVANFDGEVMSSYLSDFCIYGMDVAPDGRVWVQASEATGPADGPIQLYVISTEDLVAHEERGRALFEPPWEREDLPSVARVRPPRHTGEFGPRGPRCCSEIG